MVTRRDALKLSLGAGLALAAPKFAFAAPAGAAITRAIPSSGERLPVIGLGSSATFSRAAGDDAASLSDVLRTLISEGGKVFDTAPSYGESEAVAGRAVQQLGIADEVFWATKVNVAGREADAKADPDRALAQLDNSFERLGRTAIDLIQVHNLGDIPTQLGLLKALKAEKRVRYIGVTSTSKPAYPKLIDTMRNEPLDFIGVDYAVDNRDVEETILPLAAERGIGVLVYAPFGRTRLWQRVADRPVPDWAQDFDATTWGQFFLKFVVSHPAVTCATPATSRVANLVDNLGAGRGRLPDADQRRRMIELIEGLPAAG